MRGIGMNANAGLARMMSRLFRKSLNIFRQVVEWPIAKG
jgi:hypothetical protein